MFILALGFPIVLGKLCYCISEVSASRGSVYCSGIQEHCNALIRFSKAFKMFNDICWLFLINFQF